MWKYCKNIPRNQNGTMRWIDTVQKLSQNGYLSVIFNTLIFFINVDEEKKLRRIRIRFHSSHRVFYTAKRQLAPNLT